MGTDNRDIASIEGGLLIPRVGGKRVQKNQYKTGCGKRRGLWVKGTQMRGSTDADGWLLTPAHFQIKLSLTLSSGNHHHTPTLRARGHPSSLASTCSSPLPPAVVASFPESRPIPIYGRNSLFPRKWMDLSFLFSFFFPFGAWPPEHSFLSFIRGPRG